MNCAAEEENTNFYRGPDNNDSESSENFQKFITELFERNGVLNDLRAYLRGHIVDVLQSAETGAPPTCQKHFTQRLELVYQALNMLVAEYLLRLEFSYSLSVFVSEIPLANMVLDFARSLLQSTDNQAPGLRFNENDVWSILNYLGIQCDSVHASKIVDLYKGGQSPLLYCILKCIPMYHMEPGCFENVVPSEECLSSSFKSGESCDEKPAKRARSNTHACKHYLFCKSCQNRILRLRDKYKIRKIKMEKNEKKSSMNSLNVQSLMNSVGAMEKGLIDEMFHQLKAVYEAEAEITKEEEERKIKRSLANHALLLQKCREEMEESFKAREAELEKSVHQKKKFLWGLARALREQHHHMALAMKDVQHETKILAEKESSLKMQLTEAEQTLRKRGEEMRNQISEELIVLEENLEAMKRERDSINKERDELENLRNTYENNSKIMKQHDIDETVDLKQHYNTLKDEIVILRKYIESTKLESKSLIERGTVMDLGDGVMNNSLDVRGDDDDDRLKGSQVINDLKKQKNVNFSQSNLDEIYRQLSRSHSRSITSVHDDSATQQARGSDPDYAIDARNRNTDAHNRTTDAHNRTTDAHSRTTDARNRTTDARNRNTDAHNRTTDTHNRTSDNVAKCNHGCDSCNTLSRDVMLQLREENDRLKNFARQQREHIDALSSERERLQSRLATAARPRTAPSVMGTNYFAPASMNPTSSANAFGWRKGAGEELSIFSTSESRVLLPGDTLPFIGVLRDRNPDSRRHLISTWRALRRRLSPQTPHAPPRQVAPPECGSREFIVSDNAEMNRCTPATQSLNADRTNDTTPESNIGERPQRIHHAFDKPREKSPKSVLREAKEKLKNNVTKEPPAPRDKSPNAVLREAKMRLRKLEIEAEAVEKSYLDFRKRQSELREERQNLVLAEESIMKSVNQIELKPSRTLQRVKIAENVASNDTFKFEKSTENLKKDFDKYLLQYQTTFDIGQIHFHKNTAIQRIKPIPLPYSEINEENKETKDKNADYLETPLTEFRKLYQTQNTKKRNQDSHSNSSPIPIPIDKSESEKSSESKSVRSRQEAIRKLISNKQDELEILKENINKMYPETSTPNETELDISKNIVNITKMENLEEDIQEIAVVEENKLTFQVEPVLGINNVGVTESKKDLLLVVESSVNNEDVDSSENENEEQEISPQMTIIVSPKVDNSPKELKSPRKETSKQAKLPNNEALNAIFQADNDQGLSSVDMQLELTKEHLESEVEKDLQEEYIDDFSADVDNYYNYNSTSEGGKNSPISLPKTSEDDNFWEN